MSNSTRVKQRPRVIFFGMLGNFSLPPLQALLERDIAVCAVVLPARPLPGTNPPPIQRHVQPISARRAVPVHTGSSSPNSIAQLAASRDIPVWEVSRLADPLTHATLAEHQADVLCVACFSQRIPQSILDMPRLAALNVHPSLLPKNRGPVPLFWTFRNGELTTGVTIHLLDAGMDSGDIVTQQALPVPDGISYAQLEAQCANLGGILLAESVWQLYEGRAMRHAQDEAQGSYYSFPGPEDFIVRAEEYDARYLYNFIRGVGHWDEPVQIRAANEVVYARDCISYSLVGQMPEVVSDGKVIQCRGGTTVTVVPL